MSHIRTTLNPGHSQQRHEGLLFGMVLLSSVLGLSAHADLAIETETARLPPKGSISVGAAFEFQTDANHGHEYASPLAVEYGISNRLEALIEPVPYTSIRPRGVSGATGFGDIEGTLTYLLRSETRSRPAFAVAGEIKVPTARNIQIGTGKLDYRLYAVASKRVGSVDLHANLGYNIIGAPSGVKTRNPLDVEVAAEWFINRKFDLFAEATYVGSSFTALGGTAASAASTPQAGDGGDGPGVAPDVAGKEVVGSVGIRTHLSSRTDLFGSFSYDNRHAKLFRTGVSLKF